MPAACSPAFLPLCLPDLLCPPSVLLPSCPLAILPSCHSALLSSCLLPSCPLTPLSSCPSILLSLVPLSLRLPASSPSDLQSFYLHNLQHFYPSSAPSHCALLPLRPCGLQSFYPPALKSPLLLCPPASSPLWPPVLLPSCPLSLPVIVPS